MYTDSPDWDSMKKNIVEYVSKCPNCQQVKAKHLKPGGFTQVINVLTMKCEAIIIDFMVGLPKTRRQNESIWVIVDRMTNLSTLSL